MASQKSKARSCGRHTAAAAARAALRQLLERALRDPDRIGLRLGRSRRPMRRVPRRRTIAAAPPLTAARYPAPDRSNFAPHQYRRDALIPEGDLAYSVAFNVDQKVGESGYIGRWSVRRPE